jgi:hypothetical protein
MPPLEMIAAAIKNDIHIKTKQNVSAAQQAYEEVNLYGMVENSIASEHC